MIAAYNAANSTMFTGIVQQLGEVADVQPNDFGIVLRIDSRKWGHVPAAGDSIAVNGCCLTATPDEEGLFRFDVIRQTLEVTTLGGLVVGDLVNLEHAVTPTTMLGGHIVQGHIDGMGLVIRIVDRESERRLRIEPPPELMDCIVERGSIALDGTSMTLAAVRENDFEVALIPTTLEMTTLGRMAEGDRINIETDYIAKTVVNWMRRMKVES